MAMASDLDALGHHQQLVGMQRVLLPAEVRDRECGDTLAGPRKKFFLLHFSKGSISLGTASA